MFDILIALIDLVFFGDYTGPLNRIGWAEDSEAIAFILTSTGR